MKGIVIVLVLFVNLLFHGDLFCTDSSEIKFRKQPEIQQIRPQKPVRIRLHRNNKGEYSWDISGDNVDEIIKADRRLRRLLKSSDH